MVQTAATPPRILGLHDEPFWRFLKDERRMCLQRCSSCGTWRYPPGPACHECLSPSAEWREVSGGGELLSWIVFRKQYLPQYPAPYNVVAVRLDEGPTMISNLVDDPEDGNGPIGSRVVLRLVDMADGVVLPRFELATE